MFQGSYEQVTDEVVLDSEYLPATLEQALNVSRVFFPTAEIRARASLKVLLQKSLSANAQAWDFSYLAKGYPVEFTFNAHQSGIQYTTDIAGPQMSPNNVLAYALELLSELGNDKLDEQQRFFFETLQQSSQLSYGCWVGGRHNLKGDEYKLYLEVPEGADAMAIEWLRTCTPFKIDFYDHPINKHGQIKLEIIGYSLKSQTIECYFSITDMAPWEIGRILKPIQLENRREYLIDLLQMAYCGVIYRELPSAEMGFSYAFSPSTNESVFSLYTFASSMFGGDRRVRDAILSLCRHQGWNMDYYEHFTRPFAESQNTICTHGIFGIALDQKENSTIYIGLKPPDCGL